MKPCRQCGKESYAAGIDGFCLACSMADDGRWDETESGIAGGQGRTGAEIEAAPLGFLEFAVIVGAIVLVVAAAIAAERCAGMTRRPSARIEQGADR